MRAMTFFRLVLVYIFLNVFAFNLEAKNIEKDSITVYVFLAEECIIGQYYTPLLRQLAGDYARHRITFVGLFPNFNSKPKKMAAFKKKYKIPFELKTDYFKTKTKKFGATVTPEVVVFNETKEAIIYKGRIDDAYARIGKRKRRATTSELKDVLNAIANDQPLPFEKTEAIGCFINMKVPGE